MPKNIIILILLIILTSACGFKIANYSEINNFTIKKIESSGENKINYKLKNKIQAISNYSGEKNIYLNFITKSKKSIKEKNIKNEITKYSLEIITEVNFRTLDSIQQGSFSVKVSGDYLVSEQYSQTIKNEKDLINKLVDDISANVGRELAKSL